MSDSGPGDAEKPKIIIDEDWKGQVQAEKAAAQEQREKPPPAQQATAQSAAGPSKAAQPLPPPNLLALITMLASQAMIHLGQIPDPLTGKTELQPEGAKYYIDMIDVMEKKTEGNRTDQESRLLADVLHQLRMTYVAPDTPVETGE